MNRYFLGVDPGRSKTGLALVDNRGRIFKLCIAATADMVQELLNFTAAEDIEAVIMGNGTNHKSIGAAVKKALPWKPIYLVGEAHSTEDARKLYWKVNPPRGWRKLLPLGLQVPPEPLDAYAAVIQVRRWLKQQR